MRVLDGPVCYAHVQLGLRHVPVVCCLLSMVFCQIGAHPWILARTQSEDGNGGFRFYKW